MLDHHLLYRYGGKTLVANPSSTLNQFAKQGKYPAPTNRPASVQDMSNALSENDTDLLDYLADKCGYTPLEIKGVGETLGLTNAELAKLQQDENEQRVDIDELRRRVRFAALMTEAVIDLHATVSNPDILKETETTLRSWACDVYPEALAESWERIDRIELSDKSGDWSRHAGHALATAELRKRLGFYWQTCKRLGIDPYSGYVKDANLEPLEQFEAENAAA